MALGANSVADVADTVSVGAPGIERKIVNVAAGTLASGSTDAVTGGQFYTANQRVAAAFGATLGSNGQIDAPTYTIRGTAYDNAGSAFAALDSAVGNLQSQTPGGNSLVQQASANAPVTVAASSGGTLVDFTGTDGTRRLTGVAAGTLSATSTDAVTGSQLWATNQQVAANSSDIAALSSIVAGMSGGSTYIRVNSSSTAASATGSNAASIGSNAQASGTDSSAIGTNASASGTNAIAVGTNSVASADGAIAIGTTAASTGTNAIAIGTGASATGSVAVGGAASAANGGAAFGDRAVATATNSTALGPDASATAARGVAVGNGAIVTASNAVALGAGSVANQANTVSVGTAGSERRVTNVAAGIAPTDAVNVGQLFSVAAGLQAQIGGLQDQIRDNQREARRGVAAAMSMTPAPMPSKAGRTSWAMNTASFRGEFGFGGSLAYRLDTNAPVALTAGYAYGGGDNHGARVGLAGEF
nr:hypothetical protein [Rhodopseudomonas sp. B29]